MIDKFGRHLTNLRISLTQNCNLDCIFCHKEGDCEKLNEEMTVEDIRKIVEVASFFGVKKVKLTGGEPLLRENICKIISEIKNIPNIEEVSMTTNAVLLAETAKELKKAGLNRVNANLVSLKPEVYRKITQRNKLENVINGLLEAKRVGLNPVKLNMVVLKNVNYNDVDEMINFAASKDFILQLIELENLGNAKSFYEKYYIPLDGIEEKLKHEAVDVKVRHLHNRVIYRLPRKNVQVEFVRPFHNTTFCMNCTRMRVTASGKLKPCLMRSENHVDILSHIRNGASDAQLHRIFMETLDSREPYFQSRD